ncbi:MAG: PEGA domain-containing protein [Armatimonadetes bacterium]|nr:PEGA domain-containing protein [Armatimonadota bacterium]
MTCLIRCSLYRLGLILLLGFAFSCLSAGQGFCAEQRFGIIVGDDQDDAKVRETTERVVEALKRLRDLNPGLVDHRTLPIAVYHFNIPKHREVFNYFEIRKDALPFAGIAVFQEYIPTKVLARFPRITDPQKDAERIFEKCREITGKPFVLTTKVRLRIVSSPSDADVTMSGRTVGRTPVDLEDHDPGTFEITVAREGYSMKRETVQLSPGESREVIFTMDPVLGTLSVSSDPPGARVFLDGAEKGETPLVIRNLSPGTYKIKMTHHNYRDHSGEIRVSGKQADSLHIALLPVRARLLLEAKKTKLYDVDKHSTHTVEINRSALEQALSKLIVDSKSVDVVSDRNAADYLLSYNYAASDALVYGQIVIMDLREHTKLSEGSRTVEMPSSAGARTADAAMKRAVSIFDELFGKMKGALSRTHSRTEKTGPSQVAPPLASRVRTFPEVKKAKSYDIDRYSATVSINHSELEREVTRHLAASGLTEVASEKSEAELLVSYSYGATDSKIFGRISVIDLKHGAELSEESKSTAMPPSGTSEAATRQAASIFAQLFEKVRGTIENFKK